MAEEHAVEIVRAFIRALEEEGINIEEAYLYGSRAKGTSAPDSDLDVAIVSSDFTGDPVADVRTALLAIKKADCRIEPVYFDPESFRDEDPLAWEIKKHGLRVK